MLVFLTVMACADAPSPSPPPEAPVLAAVEAAPAAGPDDEVIARLEALEIRVDAVEIELGKLQLMVAEFEVGSSQASDVRFNPSATTLSAKDVQGALEDLALELRSLKGAQGDMGQPSGELFRIPEDGPGDRPPPRPPGGGARHPPPR